MRKKHNARRTECAYYDCHETRGLRKCWYCRKYYCQKHIQAKPTSAPPWIDKQPLWRIKDAHPCPEFIPRPPEPIVIPPMKPRQYPSRPPERPVLYPGRSTFSRQSREWSPSYSPPKEQSWISRHVRFILLLIVIGLLYYIYQNQGYLQSGNNALQNIVNNTKLPTSYASNNSTETPPKNESLNLSALGTDVFSNINDERLKQSAGQLTWNDTIAAVAMIYSNNTLLYGGTTYINDTLDYSIEDVVTYTLYIYGSCSFNSTGSLQYCTLLKQNDTLSQIDKEWFNKTSTQQVLTFQNFTDAGVGVVVNGSYAYITVILTDYQSWLKEEQGRKAEIAEQERLSEIANLTHQKINYERTSRGLNALNWSETLAGIAIMHDQDMINYNFFEHEGPNNESFEARFERVGFYSGIGENIFEVGPYYGEDDRLAEKAVDGWMNSPGHRANILKADYTYEGIGVVESNNDYYFTEDFSTSSPCGFLNERCCQYGDYAYGWAPGSYNWCQSPYQCKFGSYCAINQVSNNSST